MSWGVERNVTLWPAELASAEPPEVRLADDDDDLSTPEALRAYALVGPGATLAGLGEVVRDVFAVPAVDLLPEDDERRELPEVGALGSGLQAMAAHRVGGVDVTVDEFRCGTLLPLPAQKDGHGPWVVFLDDWLTSTASRPVILPFEVHLPAGDLVGPTALQPVQGDLDADPEPATTLEAQVRALVAGKTGPAAAATLAPGLITNPYAACIAAVETLIQLTARGTGDERACVTDLVARFTTTQLDLIAWTSGGNAVLRRCWSRSAATTPAYLRTGTALGLAVSSGTGDQRVFRTPQQRRPATVWVEPPITAEQSTVAGHRIAAMTLGRRVTHGWDPTTVATRPGPYRKGVISVSGFDGSGVPVPTWSTVEREASRRKVAVAISGNEADFDGVRLADYAYLSLGFQQWSFHLDNEGTPLLEIFRQRTPDYYDVFFGHYDLELALCDAQGRVPDTLSVVPTDYEDPDRSGVTSAAAVLAANPHAFTGGAQNASRDYYPTYVTVLHVQPNGDPKVLWLGGAIGKRGERHEDRPRRDFFGWVPVIKKVKGEDTVVAWSGTPEWGARCTVAIQCSHALLETQLAFAAFRFTRVEDDNVTWSADWRTPASNVDHRDQPLCPTGLRLLDLCPEDHTIQELFDSEYAAALLVDHHINSPSMVDGAIGRAWQRTVDAYLEQARLAVRAETGVDPTPADVAQRGHELMHDGDEVLAEAFRSRFVGCFATLRERKVSSDAREDQDWQAHYVARTRRIQVIYEHGLAAAPGSFLGWTEVGP